MERLNDLGVIVREIREQLKSFNLEHEIIFSDNFKRLFAEHQQNATIEYHKNLVVLTGNNGLKSYIPNQWFVLALYPVALVENARYYKQFTDQILQDYKDDFVKVVQVRENNFEKTVYEDLKKNTNIFLSDLFKEKITEYTGSQCENDDVAIYNSNLLYRFVSDYEWWCGGKTIDRNDFHHSIILGVLQVVNESHGYISQITNAYLCNDVLLSEIQKTDELRMLKLKYSHNRIIFGAPGTGKSYTLNKEKDELLVNGGDYERVTFHPDYSYANFVGTYKPVPDEDNPKDITYEYVPGPFMRVLVKALNDPNHDYLLIIEEINRANTAAVFGDVFQLLDRNESGESEYPIETSEDMQTHLKKALTNKDIEYKTLSIPDNMFIWATMNSADQGVYPMDTAFKRRWDFEYIGINEGEKDMYSFDFKYCLGQNTNKKYNYRDDKISWNSLRKAINEVLGDEYHLNEDKLLGPFFISMNAITQNDDDLFWRTFDNKVLMYLCDDAMRHRSNYEKLFTLEKPNQPLSYALIHNEFKKKGLDIFSQKITDAVKKFAEEDVKNYEEQTADEVNDEA